MIFFLMMFWLLGTPRPLKAGEARPPVASSFRSLSGSALLALVAAAVLACCAQAGHPPGWFPMMK
ncbi:MAG: hypothetical protein HY301_11785 [Verrucomicrobia bacterium]|nr:hypothetical protein [Verrucomicrobiota bacterium]